VLRHGPHVVLWHHLMGLLGPYLLHVVLVRHDACIVHVWRRGILGLLATVSDEVCGLI